MSKGDTFETTINNKNCAFINSEYVSYTTTIYYCRVEPGIGYNLVVNVYPLLL